MEELTPELERRIQVEELWGRRVVLEATMNDWRFREYQSRRLLSLLHSEDDNRGVPQKSQVTRPFKAAPPVQALPIFSGRRAAIITGLALFTLLAAQQSYGKFFVEGSAPSARKIAVISDGSKSRTDVRMLKAEDDRRDHPDWAHPSKLRPLDADLKRIFASSP
jgi:hypothetical protein